MYWIEVLMHLHTLYHWNKHLSTAIKLLTYVHKYVYVFELANGLLLIEHQHVQFLVPLHYGFMPYRVYATVLAM